MPRESAAVLAHRRPQSSMPAMASPPRARAAFSLTEIVIVVAILVVLAGLLVPVIGLVRRSVQHRTAAQVVALLQQSIEAYRQDDAQRRYPPQPNADRSLSRQEVDDARSAIGTLALLEGRGLQAAAEQPRDADGRLLDPWNRPYRYLAGMRRADVVADGELPDWNWDAGANRTAAWGRRPDPVTQTVAEGELLYAYVWSTGRTPEAVATWIHVADVRR